MTKMRMKGSNINRSQRYSDFIFIRLLLPQCRLSMHCLCKDTWTRSHPPSSRCSRNVTSSFVEKESSWSGSRRNQSLSRKSRLAFSRLGRLLVLSHVLTKNASSRSSILRGSFFCEQYTYQYAEQLGSKEQMGACTLNRHQQLPEIPENESQQWLS